MKKEYEMVREFHQKFMHPVGEQPKKMDLERAKQRSKWMREEVQEFIDASDVYEQARELADVIYFALGTLVEMGVEPSQVFAAVHQANMDKIWEDGTVKFHEDGKVKKPSQWQGPENQIAKVIDMQKNG